MVNDSTPTAAPKTTTPKGPNHHRLLKEAMLGLFYPAVLGTIAYSSLSALFGPLLPWATHRLLPSIHSLDATSVIRASLYLITFTFYCCDYFYLQFTNVYRVLFFVFDCFIIVGLYLTAQTIELSGLNGANTLPDIRIIVWLYIFFMVLYLVWDVLEKVGPSQSPDEPRVFRIVITWEVTSLVFLGFSLRLAQTAGSAIVLCILLAGITLGFMYVDVRKKRVYRGLGQAATESAKLSQP